MAGGCWGWRAVRRRVARIRRVSVGPPGRLGGCLCGCGRRWCFGREGSDEAGEVGKLGGFCEADDGGVDEGTGCGGESEISPELVEQGDDVDAGGAVEVRGVEGEPLSGVGLSVNKLGLWSAGGEQHDGVEVVGEGGADLLGGKAVGKQGVGALESPGGVCIGEGIDKLGHGVVGDVGQYGIDQFGSEVSGGDAEELVEKAEAVAHGAVGEACDASEGGFFELDGFLLEEAGEVGVDFVGGDGLEVEPLDAAADGFGDLLGVGGGEDELDVVGGLFEGFEQGIEGRGAEHVDFVDDVDLEAAAGGSEGGVGAELADVVDAGVGGGVDLDAVDIVAGGDAKAGIAGEAGGGGGAVSGVAVECLGEDSGGAGFAYAACSAEEVAVGDSAGGDGVLEGAGNGFLADEVVEGCGAIPAGQDGVRHDSMRLPESACCCAGVGGRKRSGPWRRMRGMRQDRRGWRVAVWAMLGCCCWAGVGGCAGSAGGGMNEPGSLPLAELQIDGQVFVVEVARTRAEQAVGLMGRSAESLPDGRGMFFALGGEQNPGFYNRGVLLDLDVAFVDREGRIASVVRLIAGDATLKFAGVPVVWAIEMQAGVLQRRGLGVGSRVELSEGLRALLAE